MTTANFTTKLLDLELIVEKSGLKSAQRVAELGCGRHGHLAFKLAKVVGPKGWVYAVDIIKSNLELISREAALHNISNLETIWSDLELPGATKIEASSLDLAFLVNTIHQTKKPLEALKEAVRISKKDGKLIIVDWSRSSSPLGPHESTRIDKNKLVDAAKKIGLYLESEFTAGQYHFGLVLKKI